MHVEFLVPQQAHVGAIYLVNLDGVRVGGVLNCVLLLTAADRHDFEVARQVFRRRLGVPVADLSVLKRAEFRLLAGHYFVGGLFIFISRPVAFGHKIHDSLVFFIFQIRIIIAARCLVQIPTEIWR